MPIGNLTSQVLANFYLSYLDHFIKHDLGIKFYGRYVDDFVLVHKSKNYLLNCVTIIRNFLNQQLKLTLHPKKIRLQRICHGVSFIGCSLQVGHINGGKRTINNWKSLVKQENILVLDHKSTRQEQIDFRAKMNSYLGILSHYNTFRVRYKILNELDSRWSKFFIPDISYKKMEVTKPIKK